MKVSLIAETTLNPQGMQATLNHLGVPDWRPINPTTHAESLIEFAGKQCYRSFDVELNTNLTRANTRNNRDYIQQSIIGQGHGSVLEHATVTFHCADVSRIVTHELIRHRPGAAYSQESGRYCRVQDLHERFYIPTCIRENSEMLAVFMQAIQQMQDNVAKLEKLSGINEPGMPFAKKKELTSAFRRIVGNGQGNDIVVSGNHRMFRHTVALRTAPGAEEEIRLLFHKIGTILEERYPAIYGDVELRHYDDSEIPHHHFEMEKV